MAAMPDLPCVLDKHWHRSEWHHLPGADTVCYRAPRGSRFISHVFCCYHLPLFKPRNWKNDSLTKNSYYCPERHQPLLSNTQLTTTCSALLRSHTNCVLTEPPLGWPQTFRGRGPRGRAWLTASVRTKLRTCEPVHPIVAIHTVAASPGSTAAWPLQWIMLPKRSIYTVFMRCSNSERGRAGFSWSTKVPRAQYP